MPTYEEMIAWKTATPTPFGRERAEEIYAARGPFGELRGVTPGEDHYVRLVWRTMPGETAWIDAFHRIRRGEVPATQQPDTTTENKETP